LPLVDQIRALALKIQTNINRIMLTRTFISDPAGYDALALEFEDIVNMAEEIV
jgi:hypothetical protein